MSALPQIYTSDGDSNFGKIGNAAIDAKIDETLSELDPDKARALANQVDKMIWQEGFNLPLYQSPGNSAVRQRSGQLRRRPGWPTWTTRRSDSCDT